MPARADRVAGPTLVTGTSSTALGTVPAGERWLMYAVAVVRTAGVGTGTLFLELSGAQGLLALSVPAGQGAVAVARIVARAGDQVTARWGTVADQGFVSLHAARLTV